MALNAAYRVPVEIIGLLTFRRNLELRPETTCGSFIYDLLPSRHLWSHVSM
jgi:hypothetical protein